MSTPRRRPKGAKITIAQTDDEFCRRVEAEIRESRRAMEGPGRSLPLSTWPHLRELVHVAVDDAQRRRRLCGRNQFGHRGWRGYYCLTNIGRVIVHTPDGVPVASSGYGAMW